MWSYKEHYMARDGVMPGHFQSLSDDMIRTHLDHCIDVLRQDMMCHVDVTPYSIVYVCFLRAGISIADMDAV
jgi:hypothetical protein